MQRGYIKVWRKIEDSGLLQLHGTLALFLYMVMQASYKPKRIGMTDIERGQLISGRFKLAAAVGLSERSVRTCLEHLHKMDMITSKPTNHFTIYTIVNYNNYQDIDTVIDQPTDQQPTSNRPATDQQPTTTKEGKKESIEEEIHTTRTSSLRKLLDRGVNDEIARDWLVIRKAKKLPLTDTAIKQVEAEAKIAGLTFGESVAVAVRNGWAGYKSSWEDKSSVEPIMLVCPNGYPFSDWMKASNQEKAEIMSNHGK